MIEKRIHAICLSCRCECFRPIHSGARPTFWLVFDLSAGVTQEGGNTGTFFFFLLFFSNLPLKLPVDFFLTRGVQQSPSCCVHLRRCRFPPQNFKSLTPERNSNHNLLLVGLRGYKLDHGASGGVPAFDFRSCICSNLDNEFSHNLPSSSSEVVLVGKPAIFVGTAVYGTLYVHHASVYDQSHGVDRERNGTEFRFDVSCRVASA